MPETDGTATQDREALYPSSAYAWYCVLILMGIYLNSFLDRQILGLLVDPIKADMGISDTQMGFLMGPSFAIFYIIAGLPLGSTAKVGESAMLNFIGEVPAVEAVSAIEHCHLHHYGKAFKAGRKVGHATLRCPNMATLKAGIAEVEALIGK